MMLKSKEIANYLDSFFHYHEGEKWDTNGLFFENETEIKKIIVCLDINFDLIRKAIKNEVNLIISHHPLLVNDWYENKFNNDIMSLAKKHNLQFIFLHTSFDKAQAGMNFHAAKLLNLKNIKRHNTSGYLVEGEVKQKCSFFDFAQFSASKLGSQYSQYLDQFKDMEVNKLVICCGSGTSMMGELGSEINLYVTCDIRYHAWLASIENNLCILNLSHNIENIFCENLKEKINEKYPFLTILVVKTSLKFNSNPLLAK